MGWESPYRYTASANCNTEVGTEVIGTDNSIIEAIKIFHLRYVAHCTDVYQTA